jgi:hypothetical protein
VICPGDPDCVVTSSGVSCASKCTITSAGLSCPGGGEVKPNEPVSGGPQRKPKRKPNPDVGVKPEREAQPEAGGGPTTIAPAADAAEESAGEALPFTGAPLLAFLVTGFALWAGGLLLRRRTATARAADEAPSDREPPAPPAAPSAAAAKPSLGRAVLLPALAMWAVSVLMSRWTRR